MASGPRPAGAVITLRTGDCRSLLREIPDATIHSCVTSPPYFSLRDYGIAGQLGQEPTPAAFVASLVAVFREVRRVLRADGTCWIVIGDTYNRYPGNGISASRYAGQRGRLEQTFASGHGLLDPSRKQKDLLGIPWRLAFALQDDGWYLRQDIVWHKPNPTPESVRNRCTRAHEYVFMLSKSARYYYDSQGLREPALGGGTRNRRSVWTIPTKPLKGGGHFAIFPQALVEPCVLAGCPADGVVLDPFAGAGTTGVAAAATGRRALLIELNPAYVALARARLDGAA